MLAEEGVRPLLKQPFQDTKLLGASFILFKALVFTDSLVDKTRLN